MEKKIIKVVYLGNLDENDFDLFTDANNFLRNYEFLDDLKNYYGNSNNDINYLSNEYIVEKDSEDIGDYYEINHKIKQVTNTLSKELFYTFNTVKMNEERYIFTIEFEKVTVKVYNFYRWYLPILNKKRNVKDNCIFLLTGKENSMNNFSMEFLSNILNKSKLLPVMSELYLISKGDVIYFHNIKDINKYNVTNESLLLQSVSSTRKKDKDVSLDYFIYTLLDNITIKVYLI